MEATFSRQPGELELVQLLRRWLQGHTKPWLHEASVYDLDPVALTAKYPPATAENGDLAWYFVFLPQKNLGRDGRKKRAVGSGTWKIDRTEGVLASSGGVHVKVAEKKSYAYTLKDKTTGRSSGIRIGWLMYSIHLNKEEDSQETNLCKVYHTTRRPNQANPLIPLLALLAPIPPMDAAGAGAAAAAAAAATGTGTAAGGGGAAAAAATGTAAAAAAGLTEMSDSSAAAGLAEMSDSSAAAETSEAEKTHPQETSKKTPPATTEAKTPPLATIASEKKKTDPLATPVVKVPPLGTSASENKTPPGTRTTSAKKKIPLATTSSKTSPIPTSQKAASPPATEDTSPPKKWIQVLVSDSPTKLKDLSSVKRVYGMVVPVEDSVAPPTKKVKMMDCRGWLTISPTK